MNNVCSINVSYYDRIIENIFHEGPIGIKARRNYIKMLMVIKLDDGRFFLIPRCYYLFD